MGIVESITTPVRRLLSAVSYTGRKVIEHTTDMLVDTTDLARGVTIGSGAMIIVRASKAKDRLARSRVTVSAHGYAVLVDKYVTIEVPDLSTLDLLTDYLIDATDSPIAMVEDIRATRESSERLMEPQAR